MYDIAILLSQRPCSAECSQGVIEEVCKRAGFRGVAVEETGAVEFAEEVTEAVKEDGLEVGVFLGRTDCGCGG